MANNVIDLKTKQYPGEMIETAKWAYTTRRVSERGQWSLSGPNVTPHAGDLVLAKVVRLGQHKRLELTNGRRSHLFPGDKVVVVYGNRYAPDQFEAIVPDGLEACHLAAAGGIASKMIFKHDNIKNPTQLQPVGLLIDSSGTVANLRDFALPQRHTVKNRPTVIAVVGSSMNSGKSTAAASLIRGLSRAGLAVNAGKVTGTGAGGDTWLFRDAGARHVMDFLDSGLPSTYLLAHKEVKQNFINLLSHLSESTPDVIVIEIADGLHQTETAQLVASKTFRHHVDSVIFAAYDSLGGVYGVKRLQRWNVNVVAVSGMLTRSPLSVREFQDAYDLPVFGREGLESPGIEMHLRQWTDCLNNASVYEEGRR